MRKLIPAAAVAAVLAASFIASPSLASSTNNCGVKGYGYHDHGKVCPNRPFPGHGKGVLRILGELGVTSTGAGPTTEEKGKGHAKVEVSATGASATVATTADTDDTTGLVNGKGKGKGHSKGHAKQL